MRLYESVLIARQDISTAQVETLVDEFSAIIENGGGSIKKREYWGLRSLAYRIKKNRKGHYVMLNLESDSATLNEYERIMGLNEDILRFMTIRIDEVSDEPSIMMQAKPERGDRGSRHNSQSDNAATESKSEEA
ncbi:MAG: 30S ribosomal protein S6 [Candidatus Puniceispirillaceae bacterium]